MDWSELQYVLVVAQAGSIAAAARVLRLSHSTVYRRVKAFESRYQVTLFERQSGGIELTEAGTLLAQMAAPMEQSVKDLERGLRRLGDDLSGRVVIAAPEGAALGLCTQLPLLLSKHPGLRIDWQLDADANKLLNRQVDIAIVAALKTNTVLVGKRLANISFAVYGSHRYIEQANLIGTENARWIVFDESVADQPVPQWELANVPPQGVVMRVNRRVMLNEAILSGVGIGVMPRLTGDSLTELKRLGPNIDVSLPLRVLTHSDLRDSAAVGAVLSWIELVLGTERARIEANEEDPLFGSESDAGSDSDSSKE